MKYIALILLLTLVLLPVHISSAIAGDVTTDISLPTVQCGMCEKTISKALDKVKGIKEYDIDIDNKKVKVVFDDEVTDLTKIETAISKAGYAANESKADQKAYDKLHDCCKVK